MKTYSLENPFLDNSYLLQATDGSIKPIAGIFIEIAEDGLAKIKNSNSTFQNVDISNNPNAKYTHDLIFNGTISIKIKAAGGEAVTVESTILTPEQLTEINSLIGGEMDSINGYTINLYQLIYKLILWEYINATYTITLKPFVIYANITNVNDNTTALDYTIPTTKITANKEVISIAADPNLIIWSDGTIRNCEGIEATYTGPGEGNIYLIGDYKKLIASNQNISSIDRFSKLLKTLNLNQNSGLNIQNSYFDDVLGLEYLDLNSCYNSKIDTILSKYNLSYLDLSKTNSEIINISNHTNLTYLKLSNTDSNIDDISNNLLLTYLNLSSTNSNISIVSNNTNLTYLNISNTDSKITDVSNNTLLTHLVLFNTDSKITDISNNTLLTHLILFNSDSNINDISNNTFLTSVQVANTISNFTDISLNTKLIDLVVNNTSCSITDLSYNTVLVSVELIGTTSVITNVNSLCRIIKVVNTNNTAANNNTLIENLINTTRTGQRELTITANPAIDQTNVNILVGRGWDVIQS